MNPDGHIGSWAHCVSIVTSSTSGRLSEEGNGRCAVPDGTVKQKNVIIDKQMTLYYKFYVVARQSICVLRSISQGRIQMVNWEG